LFCVADEGTVKSQVNEPPLFVVQGDGVVAMGVPAKRIVITEDGLKPDPDICTCEPAGDEEGESRMDGATGMTVTVSPAEHAVAGVLAESVTL
jgi:hypothetical protein